MDINKNDNFFIVKKIPLIQFLYLLEFTNLLGFTPSHWTPGIRQNNNAEK